ncbi:MAG: hypothetical protein CFK49_12645, partial [Armatimonadetes bacterium JP3_11]
MAKPLLILDRPARAPREVVERTIQHIKERDYTLRLIEWVSTPAGGFWQGAEYRFVPDTVAGRECWRVEQRNARSKEWVYQYHAPIERAIARLWQQGCGWWHSPASRVGASIILALPNTATGDGTRPCKATRGAALPHHLLSDFDEVGDAAEEEVVA